MSRKLELIVLAILLIFAAQFFYMSSTTDAEYGGADGEAEGVIKGNYRRNLQTNCRTYLGTSKRGN